MFSVFKMFWKLTTVDHILLLVFLKCTILHVLNIFVYTVSGIAVLADMGKIWVAVHHLLLERYRIRKTFVSNK